jgi:hypothetical protein
MKIAIIKLEDGREIQGVITDYLSDYFEIYNEEKGMFWVHRSLIKAIIEVVGGM